MTILDGPQPDSHKKAKLQERLWRQTQQAEAVLLEAYVYLNTTAILTYRLTRQLLFVILAAILFTIPFFMLLRQTLDEKRRALAASQTSN